MQGQQGQQLDGAPWSPLVEDPTDTENTSLSWIWSASNAGTADSSGVSISSDQLDYSFAALLDPTSPLVQSPLNSPFDSLAAKAAKDHNSRKERRKIQNRAAQRAFRQRKQDDARNLEMEVKSLSNNVSSLEADNVALKNSLRGALAELEVLRSTLPYTVKTADTEPMPLLSHDEDYQFQAFLPRVSCVVLLQKAGRAPTVDE